MSTLSIVSNLPPLHSEGGLSRYLAAIRKFPLLDPADETIYARRWQEHGDREAAYRLVTFGWPRSSPFDIAATAYPSPT
jgi:RNA polymerase sigma-32 factor